jgi:peroxiredoxin
LVLIGVHSDDWKKGLEAAKKHKIAYPITNDVGGMTGKAYKVKGYPTVYLIDKKGKVRFVDPPNLEASIKKLLAEK